MGEKVPTGWRSLWFTECASTSGVERRPTVPKNRYLNSGRFPVVDQGTGLISGYTDNEELIHRKDLPIILFGDHTRNFKFLDFPFAAGADGTKLLRADARHVDPLYLYYALLNVRITPRGYSRHFKYLKDAILLVPKDQKEQQAIADVLSKIQRAAEIQEKNVVVLRELKAATMAKLFREGLRREPLKHTEIGEIPEGWEVVPLNKVANLASGGTPSKSRADWWRGDIPWASPKDIKSPRLWDTEDHISKEALEEGSRLIPPKTILIVIRGMALAKDVPISLAEVPMAFNQDIKAVLPGEDIDADYLLYALTARKGALAKEIGTSAHGTRRMGSSSLESLLLPRPKRNEQRGIAAVLRRIEEREIAASQGCLRLKQLFDSALHLMMIGQLRVGALNLQKAEHHAP